MQAVGQLRGPLAVVLLGLSALKDWVGVGDLSEGHGTANTGMVVHGGRVMALHEDDLPYQVCGGVCARVGGGRPGRAGSHGSAERGRGIAPVLSTPSELGSPHNTGRRAS